MIFDTEENTRIKYNKKIYKENTENTEENLMKKI